MDNALLEHYRREALEYASRAVPQATPDDGAAFLAAHPDRGKLRVQASSGEGSYPVEGASVEVFRNIGSEKRVYYKKVTDSSGIADGMVLPALPKAESLDSETASDSGTEYGVTVFHPAYSPEQTHYIKIYGSVETLLPISFIPSSRQ